MDLVNPVGGPQQVGFPGAWRTTTNVHPANRSLAAHNHGATGGMSPVGVVSGFQTLDGGDGVIHPAPSAALS